MNLYVWDGERWHDMIEYDGTTARTACGETITVPGFFHSMGATKPACGRCFPVLN